MKLSKKDTEDSTQDITAAVPAPVKISVVNNGKKNNIQRKMTLTALDDLFFDLLDEHDDDHDPLREHGAHMHKLGQSTSALVSTQEELLTNLVVKEELSMGDSRGSNSVKVLPLNNEKNGDNRFKPASALSSMKKLLVKSVKESHLDRKFSLLSVDDHETMGDILESYRAHEEHLAKKTSRQRTKSMANTMNRVQARRELKSSQIMRSVEIFAHCNDEQLSRVIDAMTCMSFKKGDKIVGQGESADVFYIITQGSAKVWQKNLSNMLRGGTMVGELGTLAHFGENALVNAISELNGNSKNNKLKEVRNASVIASSPRCTVMALPGKSLCQLLEEGVINKEMFVGSIEHITEERERRTRATQALKKAIAKKQSSNAGDEAWTPAVAQKVEESRRLLPDSF